MPINPMTGRLYDTTLGNGAPIGLTALNQRPQQFKAMDLIKGGSSMRLIRYRSHKSLLLHGRYRNPILRSLQRQRMYDNSYGVVRKDPNSFRAAWEDMKRDQMTQFNPFTWRRSATMSAFDPTAVQKEYGIINPIFKKTRLNNNAWLRKHNFVTEDGNLRHVIDPVAHARLSAGTTWDQRVKRQGNRALTNSENGTIQDYLNNANPDLLGRLRDSGKLSDLTMQDAGTIMRMSMQNSITGRIGGFIEGMHNPNSPMNEAIYGGDGELTTAGSSYLNGQAYGQLGNIYRKEGVNGVRELAGKSSEELMAKGLGESAAKKFASKGATELMARVGLEVGGAAVAQFIPGVDVAVDAYLAYQIASFAAKETAKLTNKFIIQPAASAYRSLTGSISSAPFGMGYHDTLAAATSRARGVQAIQNSRLNARSVLGSEAAPIAQHFASL